MPIRIHGATPADSILLLADGAVPTQIDHPDTADVTIPFLLAADSTRTARWQLVGGPGHPLDLHPLTSDQRLVAFAGSPSDAAALLFPNSPVVPVQLDQSRPLLEPVAAWECLDAVILSASAAARVDEAHRAALLAGGTIIAVRSDAPPDDRWPWQLRGGYWILQYMPAGPQPIIEPEAYAPTFGWDRGWPVLVRRRVLFAAVLFCIFSIATLLWRSRWTAVAFLGISVLFIAWLAFFSARQSAVLQMAVAVRVEARTISQFDLWTWLSPVRSAESSFPFAGLTHPFLGSLGQIDRARLRLVCTPGGAPDRFDFHLDRGQSLAMLSRQLALAIPCPALAPAAPAWIRFADSLYGRPGRSVKGQYGLNPSTTSIPIIVLHDGR
jgi:hypothetical protein